MNMLLASLSVLKSYPNAIEIEENDLDSDLTLLPVFAISSCKFSFARGLMLEVHNDPANALCDGAQSLDLDQFQTLMGDLKKRAELENKEI